MLIMLGILPAAIEIAANTMLIIDRITVSVQAQRLPFNNPYATTNERIPIAISIPPIARMPPPRKEGGTWERSMSPAVRFCCWNSDRGTKGMMAPAIASPRPIRSIMIPPIMLRIAMIVTPVGRDFGVVCTRSRFFFY